MRDHCEHCEFTGGNPSYCEFCGWEERWMRSERRDTLRMLGFLLALSIPLFLVAGALMIPEAANVALIALGIGTFAAMASGFVAHEWIR